MFRHVLLPLLLSLLLLASPRAQAQPIGRLGTLRVGSYQSSAQGVLTGAYVPGAKLPTFISYVNASPGGQDSLAFTAQVLGNGYAQGLQLFAGRLLGLGPLAQRDYPLGDVELPGPGSYLVQVSAFVYNRTTATWQDGPVRIYWLFPLAAPLPVELVSFGAVAVRDTVTLAWNTASERSCAYFEVQRSTNGTSWLKRGMVACHGTSATTQRYRFTEAQLPVRAYYRLRQFDDDGQEQYSPVVSLNPTAVAVATASVYPNPAREQAQLTAPVGVVVRFYDDLGRLKREQTLDASGTLDLRGLKPGTYQLLIDAGKHPQRSRLVVL